MLDAFDNTCFDRHRLLEIQFILHVCLMYDSNNHFELWAFEKNEGAGRQPRRVCVYFASSSVCQFGKVSLYNENGTPALWELFVAVRGVPILANSAVS